MRLSSTHPGAQMDQIPQLKQAFWLTCSQALATIRPVTRAVRAEHTLAQHATTKAALSRRCATEVHAIYGLAPTAARLDHQPNTGDTLNRQSNRLRLAAMLTAVLTLTLLLAYGFSGAVDAVAVQPDQTTQQPGALDPSMNSLEGDTHYG